MERKCYRKAVKQKAQKNVVKETGFLLEMKVRILVLLAQKSGGLEGCPPPYIRSCFISSGRGCAFVSSLDVCDS
ncbi:hypothetical protein V6N11_070122 [Hibiscus sabdariffa]|uniref:Uncharacterized protein n=1 Tax=Hibiscus sabdariffa TaxID=183260 RepID=A0ABR2QE58_9ROSI